MRLIATLAIVMGLATAASAEDWSQYVDNNPRPLVATSKPAKQAAHPAKSVAAKPRVKARAKAKTRGK